MIGLGHVLLELVKKQGIATGNDANTCCAGDKCEKTYSDDKNCPGGKNYRRFCFIETPPNKNNCCIDKKCNDSESGLTTNEKCNSSDGAPIKIHLTQVIYSKTWFI